VLECFDNASLFLKRVMKLNDIDLYTATLFCRQSSENVVF